MKWCSLKCIIQSVLTKAYQNSEHSHHLWNFLCSFHMSQPLRWRRQWHPTPVLLPGKSHGRRSLIGCSPWGREESDTTEWLPFHFSLSCIGEGNGNPLQCSCLENPRDGGAWWAALYGSCRVGHNWSDAAAATPQNQLLVWFLSDFLGGSDSKESPCKAGELGLILWRREWQSTPVFLPEEFHGQRSLMG